MLLNSCWRAQVLFDVCRHRDRLNILQVAEARALAPMQELADGMIVSDPCIAAKGRDLRISISNTNTTAPMLLGPRLRSSLSKELALRAGSIQKL
jgi:hypothetical protein